MGNNTCFIPGDVVMTNGKPIGTAENVAYRIITCDPTKSMVLADGTTLNGKVELENVIGTQTQNKGFPWHNCKGFLVGDCEAWYDDIVPIKLTPNILVFNGWSKDNNCYYKNFNNKLVYLTPVVDKWVIELFSATAISVKYVHQLQHFLFGLDIECSIIV